MNKNTEQLNIRLEHVNSVLKSIRNVNKFIVRSKDRDSLLQGVCDCLTEARDFFNVWISLFDRERKLVKTYESGLGKKFKPMLERLKSGHLPKCNTKILEGKRCLAIKNPEIECEDCPFAPFYEGRGGICTGFTNEDINFVLTVSVPIEYVDDSEECDLLIELAEDIGFGLLKLQKEIYLEETEAKLRNIFENSTNMFYSHTVDHQLTYVSPQIKQILGYTIEEAMKKWTDFTSDNPINEIGYQNTLRAIKTGKRQPTYELELVRKDKKKIMVEVREFPVLENGKTVAIAGSLADITERKQMEMDLKESEEKFRSIFEHTPIGIALVDLNYNLKASNKAYRDLLGRDEPEIKTLSLKDFTHSG